MGFVGVATVFLFLQVVLLIFPYFPTLALIYTGAFSISQILLPVCITFSIVQYRLWDIDLIINRSLIYILASGACVILLGFTDRIAGELFADFARHLCVAVCRGRLSLFW